MVCAGIYINRFPTGPLDITWLAYSRGRPSIGGYTDLHTEWLSGQIGVMKQDDGIFLMKS